MNCTAEIVRGIIITNPAVIGVGTAVNLESLFAAGASEVFDEITVFNDTDRPVKVEWTNTSTAATDFFFVPNGGKSFSRKFNKGGITGTSLKVYSWDATIATGRVTINLSKNRT